MPNALWGRYKRGEEVDVNGDPVFATLQADDEQREKYRLRGFEFVGYTSAPGIAVSGEVLTPTIVETVVAKPVKLPPPGVSLAAMELAERPAPIVVEEKPDGEPAERYAVEHDADRNIEHLDIGKAIPVTPGTARRDTGVPQPLTHVDQAVMRAAERDTPVAPPTLHADDDHMRHLAARSDANASKTGDNATPPSFTDPDVVVHPDKSAAATGEKSEAPDVAKGTMRKSGTGKDSR